MAGKRVLMCAAVIAGVLGAAAPAVAATPSSATLSPAAPSAAWTGESAGFGPNLVSLFAHLACVAPTCDTFTVDVAEAGTLQVETAADDGTTIIDTYVVAPDGTTTMGRGDGAPAKVTVRNAAPGTYYVDTFMNSVGSPLPYSGHATLGAAGSGGDGGGGTGDPGAPIRPSAPPAESDVVVCVVDTGLNARHVEFSRDQVVAWFDFTKGTPAAGEYYGAGEPIDEFGHGTMVASMAAGLNVNPEKTPSFAPGASLAIARVGDAAGTIVGDLATAVHWCVDTAKADVINISIGSIVPLPGAPLLFTDEYGALADARAKGVFITLSNGNGVGRAGYVPSSGANSTYSSSMDTLNVGPSDLLDGPNNTDAEVAAQYAVFGPVHNDPQGYTSMSGTSFASPLVAGFAARLLQEAQAAGRAVTPDGLETLIKYSARDTVLPPSWEGYGVIDGQQLPDALTRVRAGTLPQRPSPDVNGIYVEEVSNRMRELNNGIIRFPSAAGLRRRSRAQRARLARADRARLARWERRTQGAKLRLPLSR